MVLYCDDGFGEGTEKDRADTQTQLKKFFAFCGDVVVKYMSFYHTKDIENLVMSADVFCMNGGNENEMIKLFQEQGEKLAVLRRFTSEGGLYVGCCGGAMAAGKFWAPSSARSNGEVPMLDIIKGAYCAVDEPM